MLTVALRSRAQANRWPAGVVIHDVTSRGPEPWVKFSPFYPHGGIPVPFTPGRTAMSVEGIWQALKVFADDDVDESKLDVTTMRGLKRTERRYGRTLGHRCGLNDSGELLSYVEARRKIYLPSYRWVLDHCIGRLVDKLRAEAKRHPVVLLDYTTNGNVEDTHRPLSHAALVVRYLENDWPGER